MNIQIGSLVGKGNTADVFVIDDYRVVKLFHSGYPKDSVEKEYENSKLLSGLDVPIPKSYEIITYKGRYGIVYDKIGGKSLLDAVFQSLEEEPSAISCKTVLRENINHTNAFSEQRKTGLLQLLNDLPEGDNLCHGDFHFGNVLMTGQECSVIDFMNICRGHPYFDIARTIYLTEFTPVLEDMPNRERVREFKRQFSTIYLGKMGVSRELLSEWLTIVAAGRLSELSDEQTLERDIIMHHLQILNEEKFLPTIWGQE